MENYLKMTAGAIISVILGLVLAKREKDVSIVLACAACCMVMTGVINYIRPVIDFFQRVRSLSNLDNDILTLLLKSAGIGIMAEIVCLLCADSGNAALGKTIQILATSVILWLCIPVLNELISLVDTILGAV